MCVNIAISKGETMDIIRSYLDKGEEIEVTDTFSLSSKIKNFIIGNLIYIIMWTALIGAGIYFTLRIVTVSGDYWFVVIPVAGFVVLRLWTLIMYFLKEATENKGLGCVLTNKAVYLYRDGKYKTVEKINFGEIVIVEKSDYIADGFFVSSNKNCIHVKDIKNEKEFFEKLALKVKNITDNGQE